MRPRDSLRHCQDRLEEMLSVLERLVSIDSPSRDAEAVARFAGAYAELLEQAGARCRRIDGPSGPHLFAELGSEPRGGPPVVLVGHADTVWPAGEAARRPPRREGGRLYGPGVYDMRAGLVAGLFALRCLRDLGARPRRPVRVFVSADEEVGSPTAHPPMERLVPRGATALVLEPPLEDGSLKVRRKGVGMYRLEVEGAEAHAGLDPERGASAVAEVARRVLEVLSWADPARGITVNIGRIEGGIATNVVAGRAAAGIDMRFDELPAGEEIHRRLLELRPQDLRTRIAVTGGIIFPPLVPDAATERLAAIAQRVGRELGLELGLGKSGGGSDGCHLASRGVQVLDGLGVEGGGAHSPGEHVLIERLPVRAALLASLVLALDGEA